VFWRKTSPSFVAKPSYWVCLQYRILRNTEGKMKPMMGDVASVNSFRDQGLYPFCAQAVWTWLIRVNLWRNLWTGAIYGTPSLFNNSASFLKGSKIMQTISSSIKILMSRKQEQEHQELLWSTRSTNSPKPTRHICYVYQRLRSSTYHSRHPPREPPPPQGVCRRCVREEKLEEHRQPPPAITIFEIHYYHYDCAYKQE
jgi:hypothetical protein